MLGRGRRRTLIDPSHCSTTGGVKTLTSRDVVGFSHGAIGTHIPDRHLWKSRLRRWIGTNDDSPPCAPGEIIAPSPDASPL